jgi:hypothetical protein
MQQPATVELHIVKYAISVISGTKMLPDLSFLDISMLYIIYIVVSSNLMGPQTI